MRFAMSLVALGLPCFVSCSDDQPPGEESDADTDSDTDTDTDSDTDVADAGDDIATATTIAYSDHTKAPAASDAIGEAGDKDFFALTMKAGETVLAFTSAFALDGDAFPDTVLRVLDADGNLLAENDDMPTRLEETDSAVYFQAIDDGTYYFEVLEWSDWDPTSDGPEGGSDYTYDLYTDPLGVQDDEPNETQSDADALFDKAGGALLYGNYIDDANSYALDFYGVTGSKKDVDMWRVDTKDPGFLTVVLYPGSRPWADLQLSMYDASGNLVAQTNSPEFTSDYRVAFEDAALMHWASQGDTYYFAVQDLKGTSGTTYGGMFLSYIEDNSDFETESNDVVLAGNPISMDNTNENFPDTYYATMTGAVGAGGDSVDCFSVSAADVGGSLDGIYFSAQTQAMEVGSLLDPEITIYGEDGTTVLASATDSAQWDSPDAGVTDLEIPGGQDAVYVCVDAQSSDSFADANQYEIALVASPDPVFE